MNIKEIVKNSNNLNDVIKIISDDIIHITTEVNNLNIFKETIKLGSVPNDNDLSYSIKHNNLEMFRIILNYDIDITPYHLEYVISVNNYDMCEAILERGVKVTKQNILGSIKNKNQHIFVLLLGYYDDKDLPTEYLNIALNNKSYIIFKLLLDYGKFDINEIININHQNELHTN